MWSEFGLHISFIFAYVIKKMTMYLYQYMNISMQIPSAMEKRWSKTYTLGGEENNQTFSKNVISLE